MANPQYDLITVGGGLAASALARSMAAHGARVLILEQEHRFRDRVRGEFVCPWGVAEARDLDILQLLRGTCGQEVPWVNMGMGPRNLPETTPQQLPALSFSHPEMQEALLGAAEFAGAEARRGVAVRAVEAGTPPAVVAGADGSGERLTARLVVGADGRSSATRKWAGFSLERNTQPYLLGGVLLSDVSSPRDLAHIVFNPENGFVGAIFPIGKDRYRAYLGHPASAPYRLQGKDQLPLFIAESAKVAPVFEEALARAAAIGPLASFEGSDFWVDHPYRDGIVLIGDAAATSDPTFGQGLALALRDARVLRDALLANSNWDEAGHSFAEQHDRYFHNCHLATTWLRNVFQDQSPEAARRRQKAMPLIAEDPMRVPDHLFSGPEMPVDDSVRARFYGEC
jgi:2-polyprenyl-6-methoxyphenol hydroxylase-like FAD-dependent oxidoreductase